MNISLSLSTVQIAHLSQVLKRSVRTRKNFIEHKVPGPVLLAHTLDQVRTEEELILLLESVLSKL